MRAVLKKTLPLLLLCGVVGFAVSLSDFGVRSARAQGVRDSDISAHLGDLMNESMQVHHSKLWLAGHANNWPLAAFELRKIKETIEQLKEAIVTIQSKSAKWQRFPVGEMLNGFDAGLAATAKAVTDKNAAAFETSFQQLTAACNACHARAGEPQIKIIVPTGNGPFANQDFAPAGAH